MSGNRLAIDEVSDDLSPILAKRRQEVQFRAKYIDLVAQHGLLARRKVFPWDPCGRKLDLEVLWHLNVETIHSDRSSRIVASISGSCVFKTSLSIKRSTLSEVVGDVQKKFDTKSVGAEQIVARHCKA